MYKRQAQGRAVFEKDGAYYVFEGGALVPSGYDPKEDGRGFTFDFPAYLGVQSESVRRFRYGNAYGYRSAGGSVIVTASFREAFAWSEQDVGCVIAAPNGREMLYFYNRRSQEVSRKYYAPDTRGEESVGFFYFDDEMCIRDRICTGDRIITSCYCRMIPVCWSCRSAN